MLLELRLTGKRVIVVGGGRIGERKARAFAEEGADVTVLSEDFSEGLVELAACGKVRLIRATLSPDPGSLAKRLEGAHVVVAATSDGALNSALLEAGRRVGALVYAADDPARSDFSFPAVARIDPIKVAVSTGGRSPIMAKLLCERLARQLGESDVRFLELQAYARRLAKRRIPSSEARRRILWKIASSDELRRLASEGKLELAKREVESMIRVEAA